MNIKEEKKAIIELLNESHEEWVLLAVKKLLSHEEEISNEEKSIIDERMNLLEEGKTEYANWDKVKKKL